MDCKYTISLLHVMQIFDAHSYQEFPLREHLSGVKQPCTIGWTSARILEFSLNLFMSVTIYNHYRFSSKNVCVIKEYGRW